MSTVLPKMMKGSELRDCDNPMKQNKTKQAGNPPGNLKTRTWKIIIPRKLKHLDEDKTIVDIFNAQ